MRTQHSWKSDWLDQFCTLLNFNLLKETSSFYFNCFNWYLTILDFTCSETYLKNPDSCLTDPKLYWFIGTKIKVWTVQHCFHRFKQIGLEFKLFSKFSSKNLNSYWLKFIGLLRLFSVLTTFMLQFCTSKFRD